MRLRDFFRRRREYDDLSAEIRAHLGEKTDALVAAGMNRPDAERAARKAFGNVGRIEEQGRDVWRAPTIDDLMDDIRHACRVIRRHPSYAAGLIAVSALGIVASATTFSVVSGVLLAPLGFPASDRVYELAMMTRDGEYSAAVPVDVYARIAADTSLVQAVSAGYPRDVTVDWGGEPEIVDAERVTPSYFRVYGITPVIGRGFTRDEGDAAAPVTVLGHDLWRQRFGADSGVIGQSVNLDGQPHTVVGVMPEGFRAFHSEAPGFWMPESGVRRGAPTVNAQLLVRAGVDSARVAAWLAAAPVRVLSFRTRDSVVATPVIVPITERVYGDVDRPLRILFGAVVLVLLLAAANVATMQLARMAVRAPELGIRRAIGATGLRQAQHLIVESLVITGLGCVAGAFASYWTAAAIGGLGVRVLPRMDLVGLDARTLGFAVLAAAFIGVVGGLVPAIAAPRQWGSFSGSRVSGTRTSSLLVATQVALSVVLLVGAGLLVKGFLRVLPSSPGYETRNRATLLVSLNRTGISVTDSVGARRFVADVSQRMRAMRGVLDVTVMSFAPMFGSVSRAELEVPDRPAPDRPFFAYGNLVASNWLDVMRVRLVQGRAFSDQDVAGAPAVALINETAARRLWQDDASVVGRQLTLVNERRRQVTVVGVVGDTRMFGSDSRPRPQVFFPVSQGAPRYVTFIAATAGNPGSVARELRRAVWAVEPRLPVSVASDLETIAMSSVRRPRFFAWAVGAFAAVAIALSGVAIYGLLAFAVAQRRREIGVRLAIGATPGRIGRSVLLRAGVLGGAGTVAGLAAAFGLSRYLESLLVEVSATDSGVFMLSAAGVMIVSLIAASVPALRAVRVDPAISLRE